MLQGRIVPRSPGDHGEVLRPALTENLPPVFRPEPRKSTGDGDSSGEQGKKVNTYKQQKNNKTMELETLKTIIWTVTTLICSGIIGWHVADYIRFKRNLK